MKFVFRPLIIVMVLVAVLSSRAMAQDAKPPAWSVSGAWDFRANSPLALVTHPIKTAPLSKTLSLSIDGFAGVSTQVGTNGTGGLTGGGGLSLVYTLNTSVSFSAGAGFGVFAGDSPHPLIYGALAFRF